MFPVIFQVHFQDTKTKKEIFKFRCLEIEECVSLLLFNGANSHMLAPGGGPGCIRGTPQPLRKHMHMAMPMNQYEGLNELTRSFAQSLKAFAFSQKQMPCRISQKAYAFYLLLHNIRWIW